MKQLNISPQQGFMVAIGVVVLIGLYVVRTGNSHAAPLLDAAPAAAQDDGRSTPAPVQLPTDTPSPTPLPPSPTRTPTSQGPAFVEAINPDANVRSGPDLEFDRLGRIQPGETYIVLGRQFRWFQIEYPNSPTRTAWVFDAVVTLTGDLDQIPDLSQQDIPTIDPNLAAAAETRIAISQTPGGLLTLTAEGGGTAPDGLFTTTPLPSQTLAPGERLPTFTFPPFTYTPIPIEQLQQPVTVTSADDEPFAPAIPVLGLLGLGILGLLVGIIRRV